MEFETTMTTYFECANEECAAFEKEIEIDAPGTLGGGGDFYAVVACPTCEVTHGVERYFSESELYNGPDTLEEAWGEK